MKREEYYFKCQRTCPDLGSLEKNIAHMSMGVITEFGELIDIYKKELAYNKTIDRPNLVEELGDIQWYMFNAMKFLCKYDELALDLIKEGNTIVTEGEQKELLYQLLEQGFNEGEPQYMLILNVKKAIEELNENFIIYREIDIISNLDIACKLVASILLIEEIMKFVGVNPEEAYARNISKLMVRFPEKFSQEDALIRDLIEERKTLE